MQKFIRALLVVALAVAVLVMCATQSVLGDDAPGDTQPPAEDLPTSPAGMALTGEKEELQLPKSEHIIVGGGGGGIGPYGGRYTYRYRYSYPYGGGYRYGWRYPLSYWNVYGRPIYGSTCPYGYSYGDWYYC